MGYNFNSAWSSAGMEYKVTTQQLVTTYPSHKPAPNQALVATYPSHKQETTTKLVTTYPSHKQAHTTALETTGVHRREYDPYGDFNFIVEIDGISAGAFEKCDGLSWELDVIQYRFSEDPWGRLRRGQDSYGRIKLTRGYTTSSALWDWCNEIMGGGFGRKTGAVYLLNDAAETVAAYRWVEGFPCKWSGFRFDGKSSGSHSVEEIEIAVEKIVRG